MADDAGKLVNQLRAVMLNNPITPDMHTNSEEFRELEEGFAYLSKCLRELDKVFADLCAGNLNAVTPGRDNVLAGRLKELHAILKHLTWQAEQVANGDYNQTVNFLGEFSDSFNRMVQQLREREISLSAKTEALAHSTAMLKSALDGQRNWVVVVDHDTHKVVYVNLAAKWRFYDPDTGRSNCGKYCGLLHQLLETPPDDKEWEYSCTVRDIILKVRSVPIEWEGHQAAVCSLSDVTDEREQQEQLQSLAYRDELTGAYNRRYCVKTMMRLLVKDEPFVLVMLDLDGLKTVNDKLGHHHGDDYIITVAHTIMEAVRSSDRFCRIGGDEFVVILPQCDEFHARHILKCAITDLAALPKCYSIGVSYGLVKSEEISGATPDELLAKADTRMYQMKQTHKNDKQL